MGNAFILQNEIKYENQEAISSGGRILKRMGLKVRVTITLELKRKS